MLKINFPYPPSINHLWRRGQRVTYLSAEGRAFYARVVPEIKKQQRDVAPFEGRLAVSIKLYPPDFRRRDIDNSVKVIFDALTKAGVWLDDCQVDKLKIERCEKILGGKAEIYIEEINAPVKK